MNNVENLTLLLNSAQETLNSYSNGQGKAILVSLQEAAQASLLGFVISAIILLVAGWGLGWFIESKVKQSKGPRNYIDIDWRAFGMFLSWLFRIGSTVGFVVLIIIACTNSNIISAVNPLSGIVMEAIKSW